VHAIAEILRHERTSAAHQDSVPMHGQRTNDFRKFTDDHGVGYFAVDDIVEQLTHFVAALAVQHLEDRALDV